MATHATGDFRSAGRTPRGAPRVNYDVARRCRAIGLSIVALLAVFVALMLI
ncbi:MULTISPECIES: hypothetical protein [Gordonia]|uniref:hypothetical protein n=1 Tax=Gordonia TaxID=2053 RepID=UPI0013A9CF45|nr:MULTISPECIES: hypothetical protein [Gordonia]KAF0969245.1 hypothetical protein BPODLACK_02036 [Gordonia sp. YY1]MCZ0910980.1 hypothetical protein [Gordonia amicalis]MDJ0453932.1 hypothetical protein [Gordonia amicalis]MDV7077077.1 hypothetical protein [Gordonia amicalis]UKO92487.1 hypothetical protein IHQ52_03510 [Gordonia amicalis]